MSGYDPEVLRARIDERLSALATTATALGRELRERYGGEAVSDRTIQRAQAGQRIKASSVRRLAKQMGLDADEILRTPEVPESAIDRIDTLTAEVERLRRVVAAATDAQLHDEQRREVALQRATRERTEKVLVLHERIMRGWRNQDAEAVDEALTEYAEVVRSAGQTDEHGRTKAAARHSTATSTPTDEERPSRRASTRLMRAAEELERQNQRRNL